MVVVSYSGKEINAKLVYYGPGLSGKTTNLESIYQSVPTANRGKMVSMKTRTERTLFFDFLPIDLGDIGGFKTRFLLYTVPGQVYYNATRKLVLRGVDAVIFVADSARGKMEENLDSLQNLRDNLEEYGLNLDALPWVIQYNKRDLPDVYSVEELEETLNPGGVPCFEAVATTGEGVFESFRGIARILLQKLNQEIKLGEARGAKGAPAGRAKPPAARTAEMPTAPVSAPGDPTPVPELPRSAKGPAAPYRPRVPPAMRSARAKDVPPPRAPAPAPPAAPPRAAAPSRPAPPPRAPEPVPPSPIMEAADPPSGIVETPSFAMQSPLTEAWDEAPPVPEPEAPPPSAGDPFHPAPTYRPRPQEPPPTYRPRSEEPPPAPPRPPRSEDSGLLQGPASMGSGLLSQPDAGRWPQEDVESQSDFGSLLAGGDDLDEAPAPPRTLPPLSPLSPAPPPSSLSPAPPSRKRPAPQSDDRLKRAEDLARRLELTEQEQDEKKVGFFGKLFGRKSKAPDFDPPLPEPRPQTDSPVAFTDPREALDRPGGPAYPGSRGLDSPGLGHGFRPGTPSPLMDPGPPEPRYEPEPEPSVGFGQPAVDDAPILSQEAKLSGIEVSACGNRDVGPVVIQRQIQVPITLGREELIRGATLRLTLDIRVEADESEETASNRDSQVA